jgi:methionine synthase II (cobalamin-independent)
MSRGATPEAPPALRLGPVKAILPFARATRGAELAFRFGAGNKQLGVGAVDVQAPNIETAEQVAERITVHRWLAPEQTIITSTCGFNHLPRHIALGKMRAMTGAKAILSGGSR